MSCSWCRSGPRAGSPRWSAPTSRSACAVGKRVWVQRLGHQIDPLQTLGGAKGTVLRNQYYVSSVWYPRGLTVALVLPKPTG